MLVTPDPLFKPGLRFTPVFDYEQVLVVGPNHRLRGAGYIAPQKLAEQTLITYPVSTDRLDIYTEFLMPAGISPRQHRPIETTDIMLLMVAHGRGVAALPRWLVEENAATFDIEPVRLGRDGVSKQILLGLRESDSDIDYMRSFIELASKHRPAASSLGDKDLVRSRKRFLRGRNPPFRNSDTAIGVIRK